MSEFEPRRSRTDPSHLMSPARPGGVTQPARAAAPAMAEQHALGNQAAQRFAQSCLMRLPGPNACPFGGACHACPSPAQARLIDSEPIGRPQPEMAKLPIREVAPMLPFLQRLVPDSGASTSAPAGGITSFSLTPGMVADEVSTAGRPAGHNEGVEFALSLAGSANPADFAIVQLVRGSMTYRNSSGSLHYVNVTLHGASVPFHFHNWVVDSLNSNPEYGTTHSPPAAITSRTADWGDEPGISPGALGAELPVPTRFKVWFRTGIYRRPIPATVAQFQSARPAPLAELRWAMHWRNQGSPPRIVDMPISPM